MVYKINIAILPEFSLRLEAKLAHKLQLNGEPYTDILCILHASMMQLNTWKSIFTDTKITAVLSTWVFTVYIFSIY